MSRTLGIFAAVATLYGAINLLSIGAANHAYTIVLTGSSGNYSAAKDDVMEIDYGFTTTFTIQNNADVDLDLVFDAGPNGRKCRVDFTPNEPGKCETPRITVPRQQSRPFTATAKDMQEFEYSYFKVKPLNAAMPRFSSDIRVGPAGGELKKVDPDLELERDYGLFTEIGVLVVGLVLAFFAWYTRRRS